MECVSMETGNPLTLLRFEAAVKVIKSLPPDGKDDLRTVFTVVGPAVSVLFTYSRSRDSCSGRQVCWD